jgi:PhnB protein
LRANTPDLERKMMGVTPYIAFNGNCREAIDFYKGALDAQVLFIQTVGASPVSDFGPPENIMHCTIKAAGSTIMMCDDPRVDVTAGSGNISLAIGLNDPEEARKLFDNLAEGGSVVMPLEKTFWAEAFGMLTDKFGVKWMINCDAPK